MRLLTRGRAPSDTNDTNTSADVWVFFFFLSKSLLPEYAAQYRVTRNARFFPNEIDFTRDDRWKTTARAMCFIVGRGTRRCIDDGGGGGGRGVLSFVVAK